MKINDLKSLHHWVRSASISEVVFVSALVLPLYLSFYSYTLENIYPQWKLAGTLVGLALYLIGLIWMKFAQTREETNLHDLTRISRYITDKNFQFMSFEKIAEIDPKFDEDRVRELIAHFPEHIRLAKLKDNKKGIKVLNVVSEK